MEFYIGLNSIASYKRLAYSPWHAIAEFVDNSTQSYFDNKEILDQVYSVNSSSRLSVSVAYEVRKEGFSGKLTIEDNAMGMSLTELDRAMKVGMPPENRMGRSKYGMGLKTAASWVGNLWSVRTKKYGESVEYSVEVDVNRIAGGNKHLELNERDGQEPDAHYTVIEIREHNHKFYGRTISNIKEHLSSMYRQDFRDDLLDLYWGNDLLRWNLDNEDALLESRVQGKKYIKDFEFNVKSEDEQIRIVKGRVGILKSGSRAKAGFSILHADRVIKGYPDSWRPRSLYGQMQGSNDLVNQRLFGEIHLDEFEVSHTKDQIIWFADEEMQVEDGLREYCSDYKEIAKQYRHALDDQRGPTESMVDTAIGQLQIELASKQLSMWVSSDLLLDDDLVKREKEEYVSRVISQIPKTFTAEISADLIVLGFVDEMSPNDPYLTVDRPLLGQLYIIVNRSHPHWKQLKGADGVLNFLRHCVYDGIAEYMAQNQKAMSVDLMPDTIKTIKDRLLRIAFDIEQHALEKGTESTDDSRETK